MTTTFLLIAGMNNGSRSWENAVGSSSLATGEFDTAFRN